MIDNSGVWSEQAEDMIQRANGLSVSYSEAVQFATSMLTALYGAESSQLRQFRDGCEACSQKAPNPKNMAYLILNYAISAIKVANRELKAGLIVKLRIAVAGEILSELIGLAKEVLIEQTEAAKNISAVLIAAAYESLIRRMGEDFAGITARPKLEEVITALKNAGVLAGSVGTALSYLKFRNDSLHADWKAVDRPQVESCLAFTESLLMKHFK